MIEPEDDKNDIPTLTDPRLDLRILSALRRIIREIELHSRRMKAAYGVTTHQLVCLTAIKENGPISETTLAKHAQLSSSTVVGILSRLEEKGLITRRRSLEDRRTIFVSATDKGLRLVQRAPFPLQEGLAQALQTLPELELATIALSLERVVEIMVASEVAPQFQVIEEPKMKR